MRLLPDGRFISAVSFGCSSIWAKPAFDECTALALLDAAYQDGINYFDTGPSYSNGEAELRLGKWLQRAGPGALISTKVGTNFGDRGERRRSFHVTDMERSLTDSLRRLGREQVDILYLHGPARHDLNDDVLKFFETEKRRGRIVWSGVNSFDVNVLTACVGAPIDALMIQYNVADRGAEHLLPKFANDEKIIISGTALARAIYAPETFFPKDRAQLWYLLRALKSDPFFMIRGALLMRRMDKVGGSGVGVALRFVVGHPLIHSAIFGTRSLSHMRANIQSGRSPLTEAQRRAFGG